MHVNRQELLSSANRRVRRVRRTTGRLLVSALGFGVAYYLDIENGEARRKRLQLWLRRTSRRLESVFDSEAGDPPPVFSPSLRHMPEARAPGDAVGMAVH
jgi:hypothetical protein